MTPDNVARIVNQIVSTWPAGVKGHVWTDVLASLEYDLARRAYIELREHEERPPTVARFLASYHAERHSTSTDGPEYCELCGGDGWVASPQSRAHNPRTCQPDEDHPCRCHAVEPCRCTTGRRRVDVHRRIVEHNDRQPWHRPIESPEQQLPL